MILLKKGDVAVISTIVAAALVFAVLIFTKDSGTKIRLTLNGKKYSEYSLNSDRTVKIETEFGKNTLVIKNGSAHFEDCSCPDKLCEKQGNISKIGETAVCLPNRLVAEVTE